MAVNKNSDTGTWHLLKAAPLGSCWTPRDAEEAAAFDGDAAFRPDLKSLCALKEIFTVISLCASMSQWQK